MGLNLISKIVIRAILVVVMMGGVSNLKADTVISFEDLFEGDLVVDGFELKAKAKLEIFSIGAELKHSDEMYAYAWILDADTREQVWIMEDEDTRKYKGSKHIREFEGTITLDPGRYEAYYYVGQSYNIGNINIEINNLTEAIDLLGSIFDGNDEKYEYYHEHIEDLVFTVEAPEGTFTKFSPVKEKNDLEIVNFKRASDQFHEEQGFSLSKDIKVHINAIGEYYSGNRVFVDFGWIMNADTREKIWKMDKWNTSWAGGGRKNRSFVGEIDLPAGNYVAHYVTDDSHSFGEWNTMPPCDPLNYGLTISVMSKNEKSSIGEYIDDYSEPCLVRMDKVRNSQYKSKGFTIKKDVDLHIVAIGEHGYSDEFVDYGWIESLADDDVVWEMTEDNTDYAGGARKNRMFDGIVSLPAGSYMVHYTSDDSHSYRRWNDSPPYEPQMWGITLFGAGKDFDSTLVTFFDNAPEASNVIAAITGVGDDEEIDQMFSLDKSQRIRIFALGEGDNGRMHDYGWIENSKGDIIWEMTYRKSRHGGGASKNRKVDTQIYLEAGEYELYYLTDGSHSFPDFNASRPNKAHKWGITIYKAE